MPRLERRAAHVPGAARLVTDYEHWLAQDGHGSLSYRNAAWSFLARWPDLAAFAYEPLEVQEGLGVAQRPFVTYLMATGRLRPGYDYLTCKIVGLLAHTGRGPMAGEVAEFTAAATDLDYSPRTVRCAAERVIVRLLIQTGRPLRNLTVDDLDQLAAAMRRRAVGGRAACCSTWASSTPDRPTRDPGPARRGCLSACRIRCGPYWRTTAPRQPRPTPRPPSRRSPATSARSPGS